MQVLPFPLAWGRCCQKCCPVVSVERSWLVGVSRKAALPLCFQYGLLCVSPQHNSTGCSWLLLPPCLKHPARKGGPGLRGNQCDFRFGQERSVKMEQVEQAASTGYLDGTKCFAVCQVDWAVRRFRYMWQFSHICLISSKRWVAEQHRLDFSLFFFFFLQVNGSCAGNLQIFWKNLSKTFLEGHLKSLTTGSGQSLCVNPVGLLFFLSWTWHWEADSQEICKGREDLWQCGSQVVCWAVTYAAFISANV